PMIDGSGNLYWMDFFQHPTELPAGSSTPMSLATNTGSAANASRLARDPSGNLFFSGTTNSLTPGYRGTVFELAHGSTTVTSLVTFSSNLVPNVPIGGIVRDPAGNIFGITSAGGTSDKGAFYELPAGSSTPLVLESLDQAPDSPSLTIDGGGNVFAVS